MDEKERCESKLGFSVSGVISSIAARYTNQAIVTLRESCPAQPGLRVGSLWHRASSIVPLHLRDGRVCEEWRWFWWVVYVAMLRAASVNQSVVPEVLVQRGCLSKKQIISVWAKSHIWRKMVLHNKRKLYAIYALREINSTVQAQCPTQYWNEGVVYTWPMLNLMQHLEIDSIIEIRPQNGQLFFDSCHTHASSLMRPLLKFIPKDHNQFGLLVIFN